jgi:RsiW-degrading membrane proteinase PrsW (M82 family)
MSITISGMQMKFYLRVFANEDWQTFFFWEYILFPLLIKIPWSTFSEKNNPHYSVGSRIVLTQNVITIFKLKFVKEMDVIGVATKSKINYVTIEYESYVES